MAEPIIQSENKLCSKCHTNKPLSEFGIYKRNKDGLNKNCKDCVRDNVYKSRYQQKIKNESAIMPKILKIKTKINSTDDPQVLLKLSEKLAKMAKFRQIEMKSTPTNTVKFTYNTLFRQDCVKTDEMIKNSIFMPLMNVGIQVNTKDIELITYKDRCTVVLPCNITNEQREKLNMIA
jgi:hypothetical protein